MITLIKIYQYRETAGYYRSGPALEGTACGRGYKLFSLFFTSLLGVNTLYSGKWCLGGECVTNTKATSSSSSTKPGVGGFFLHCRSVLLFALIIIDLHDGHFFSNDGMVILFFQGTIAIDGFPMVLSPPNNQH